MELIIAEKPSLARAIREVVGKEYTVTNAFGHILELAEPDSYTSSDVPVNPKTGKKRWRMEDLPIFPDKWIKHPKPDAKEQLMKIKGLLDEADLVVNAGDPDREGQLLIDEILEYCRYRGPVQRVWLASLDETSVRKAFANLRRPRHLLQRHQCHTTPSNPYQYPACQRQSTALRPDQRQQR